MDSQLQSGGTQFSVESLMTPNFVFFVITIAVIGYLYYTRNVLGRDSDIKSESNVMFEKQMYLELGFMIILGFCIFIFGRNDNTTFVWIYVLVPILYLMIKSLLIFNKVTDYMDRSPENVSLGTDIADIIKSQKTGQVPVTQMSNVTNAVNQNLANQLNSSFGIQDTPMKKPTNDRNSNIFGTVNGYQTEGFGLNSPGFSSY